MRGEHDIGQIVKWAVRWQGFGFGRVDQDAQPSGKRLGQQCLVIHQPTPRGVDEDGMIGHQRQFTGADHMARFRQDRCVQRDHIGAGEKFIQLRFPRAEGGCLFRRKKGIVNGNLKFAARQHLHHQPPDA